MKKTLVTNLVCLGLLFSPGSKTNAQITLLKDYQNYKSAAIGTFQGINFREAGFSGLFPIAGTDGKEFWVCSDRGVNIDDASANPTGCQPTYDKMFVFPNYAPKLHRIRVMGDSVQILQTISVKRPNGTGATGKMNPTGLGSTATEVVSTDTVLNCANFNLKTSTKDTFGLDCEAIFVDKDGFFWLSEEGGPTIWKLDANGKLIKRYTPYANLPGLQSVDVALDTVWKYRKNNRGFEDMTVTPSGKIYAAIQSPLLYPDQTTGENTQVHRILELDPLTNTQRMFVYMNDSIIGTGSNQIRLRDWKLSDMAAINDTTFLIIEAAARGTSDIKRVYTININGATAVTSGYVYNGKSVEGLLNNAGLAANNIVPVKKTLFMDLLANNWPAALDKCEGLAILNDSTVVFCNDNDYGQTCPLANGIAIPTTNTSHVIVYGLKGTSKLVNYKAPAITLSQGQTAARSSQSPYILPTQPGVKFTSIITATDTVGGYKMCGLPDGLGAYDNGNGTFTVVMNHEVASGGAVRAHGVNGAFVSKWVINKSDLSVVSGSDVMKTVNFWNAATNSYVAYNSSFPQPTALSRFCSADMAAPSAFYNEATGLGTKERIFMDGEESGDEGRPMAHIITGPNAGTSWEMPWMGNCSWENLLANPGTGDKTVVAGTDDATPGQVYFYVGTKQSTGTEIEKAGLSNGRLYGPAVTGMLTETSGSIPSAGTAFTMKDLGDVHNLTGATIQSNSNTLGITQFLRPEDGAWDPNNPADFYFNTTNAFGSGGTNPSRVWKLHFSDINDFTKGGTITAVLDGTEGQNMLDNMTIDNSGHIILVEDVGNNAWLGRVLQYDIATDQLKVIGIADSARFINGSANFLTQDEEASGPLDVQEILGPGMFITTLQDHHSISGEVVEGGQLLAFFNPDSYNNNPEITLQGNSVTIDDGDITPSSTDNTDFGLVNKGTPLTKTFSIQNGGPGKLIVTDINFTGVNASEFTLVTPPTFPLTIAVSASQTITVQFMPGVDAVRTAKMNIVSNDLNERNYDVVLQGTGASPEVNIQGNSITITDGDATAGTANNTDFGSININSTVNKTFSIQNTGTGVLTVTGVTFSGTNNSEFILNSAPAFPLNIAANGSQALSVDFKPLAAGLRTATINIANNDADEGSYDFALQGMGLDPSAIASTPFASMVRLYPNPTGDVANISVTLKNDAQINVKVYDLQGREAMPLMSKNSKAGDQVIKLNTSTLNSGIYFVEVSAGTQATKIKMVIIH